MASAFYSVGGALDLFLSVMLWLIFDQNKTPTVIVDGPRAYSVVEVLKVRDSLNSLDCEYIENEDNSRMSGNISIIYSPDIAKRMI